MTKGKRATGTRWLEMLAVVLIITIVGAVTLPQLSLGGANTHQTTNPKNMIALQDAIYCYFGEHMNTYPGATGDGANPANSPQAFVRQLTMHSDIGGRVSPTQSSDFPFGPYLRNGVPPQEDVGNNSLTIVSQQLPLIADPDTGTGWIYNNATGQITANTRANAARQSKMSPFKPAPIDTTWQMDIQSSAPAQTEIQPDHSPETSTQDF